MGERFHYRLGGRASGVSCRGFLLVVVVWSSYFVDGSGGFPMAGLACRRRGSPEAPRGARRCGSRCWTSRFDTENNGVIAAAAATTTTSRRSSSPLDSNGADWTLQQAMAGATGDADRWLRMGMSLEKYGQFRAAAEAFHEAATLYQCFLDHNSRRRLEEESGADTENGEKSALTANEFGHVTSLWVDHDHAEGRSSSVVGCSVVLAYACVRLAHLSHDALGFSRAAARLYKEAIAIDKTPSSVSFHGVGMAVEASSGGTKLAEAVRAYREALRCRSPCRVVSFHLAVALERLGQAGEAGDLLEALRRSESPALSCLVDSWGYVRWHMRRVPNDQLNLHRGTRAMLQVAVDAARDLLLQQGLVCEFGVASGRSLRILQELLPLDTPIHGFDTFTGLPSAWGNEPAGTYSTGGVIPTLEGDVFFHKGLFGDTIPRFLEGLAMAEAAAPDAAAAAYVSRRPLALANVDCDLYKSTLDVLEALHGRIVPGTVLVFDEYLCHATWRQDEFRAWRECCKRFGWQYEYLAFSLGTKQAVVRVTAA